MSPSVSRIDYRGLEDATLRVVSVVGERAFRLTSAAPPYAIPRLVSIARVRGAWSCSSYDELSIRLDTSAAALRARWTRNDGSSTDYWLVSDSYPAVSYGLGQANCGVTTLPPRDIDAGGHLTLFAILGDGSEHAIADALVIARTMPLLGTLVISHPIAAASIPLIDPPWGPLGAAVVLVLVAARSVRTGGVRIPRAWITASTCTGRGCRRGPT